MKIVGIMIAVLIGLCLIVGMIPKTCDDISTLVVSKISFCDRQIAENVRKAKWATGESQLGYFQEVQGYAEHGIRGLREYQAELGHCECQQSLRDAINKDIDAQCKKWAVVAVLSDPDNIR